MTVPIEDLLLDLRNPRIGEVPDQPAALTAIIELDLKHFRNMMRSIAEHGLDPGDSFYIVDESAGGTGADYTVVDGNRRLAATKVLINPDLLKSTGLVESVTKPLIRIAEGFDSDKVAEVSCVLFEDRAIANEWILRRHTGGRAGEGRISWNPLEIQRFKDDRKLIDIIHFVEANSTFSDEDWTEIKTAVLNAPSTLERLVDSKTGRERLGLKMIEVEGGAQPHFDQDVKYALELLSRIFSDIKDEKIDTRRLNTAAEITAYFDDLPKELQPGAKKKGSLQPFVTAKVTDKTTRPRAGATASAKTKGKASAAKPAVSRAPKVRKTLAPKQHPFKVPTNNKALDLLREAGRLNYVDTPLASAYVFRAFIEHTVGAYFKTHSLPTVGADGKALDLAKRAGAVVEHLISAGKGSRTDLNGAKQTLTNKTGPTSVSSLNGYHHGSYQIPDGNNLRVAWDNCVPLFIAIYGAA